MFVLSQCSWWADLRGALGHWQPREAEVHGSLSTFDFGCFAPDCTAQGLISPVGNTFFLKTPWKCTAQGLRANALGILWPHGPNLSIINLIFWKLFFLPFPGELRLQLPPRLSSSPRRQQRKLLTNQSGFPSFARADEEEGFAVTNCELCPGSAASQHKPQPTVAEPLHVCVKLRAIRNHSSSICWGVGEYLSFLWHFFPHLLLQ